MLSEINEQNRFPDEYFFIKQMFPPMVFFCWSRRANVVRRDPSSHPHSWLHEPSSWTACDCVGCCANKSITAQLMNTTCNSNSNTYQHPSRRQGVHTHVALLPRCVKRPLTSTELHFLCPKREHSPDNSPHPCPITILLFLLSVVFPPSSVKADTQKMGFTSKDRKAKDTNSEASLSVAFSNCWENKTQ